jgi:hypothetical protein
MIWFVDIRSGRDVNDGKTPGSAFASLQRAILTAKPGDTVYLAPGLYDRDLEKQVRADRGMGLIVAVSGGH